MKTYKPGDVALALGISISSIRNWTAQPEFQEFLSDMAKRVGTYHNSRQREYTEQDVYVLNTIARQKTRFNTWEDVAEYLRAGHLDTELPPSAALVTPMTAAEGFADAIILRQQIDTLVKSLDDAEEEIKNLRRRIDEVREEEQEKSRQREAKLHEEIVELNRQIARLELRAELLIQDKTIK
jgi:DNA-binding transcriptional MerR regulator